MKWDILGQLDKSDILNLILENRGLRTNIQKQKFLNPPKPETITLRELGISSRDEDRAIKRIQKAIKNEEQIVVYGDYDADGITAAAVLWETLFSLSAKVNPFIPDRAAHGYGLSLNAIDELIQKYNPALIITVDNGITAHESALYCREKGIDLIITDHHAPSDIRPDCHALIHSTKMSGAGVAWVFSQAILKKLNSNIESNTMDLSVIGTVADLVPLVDFNRSLVKWGLGALQNSKRVGLNLLAQRSGTRLENMSQGQISYGIAPRLNAMGRLENALDSLRLLCTSNSNRADQLCQVLENTNINRQDLTLDLLNKAIDLVPSEIPKLIIIQDSIFHEGVVGLVAGKLAEKFYRPVIVISQGDEISKASARSVKGINIIDLIRSNEHLLLSAGGHPMAAGFSIKTELISQFFHASQKTAESTISNKLLTPSLEIDCELKLEEITWDLYQEIKKLEPFGMANPTPVFALSDCKILAKSAIGKEGRHLKLSLSSKIDNQAQLTAIWFGQGEKVDQIQETCSIAFTLNENIWNGKKELQLIIKDIH